LAEKSRIFGCTYCVGMISILILSSVSILEGLDSNGHYAQLVQQIKIENQSIRFPSVVSSNRLPFRHTLLVDHEYSRKVTSTLGRSLQDRRLSQKMKQNENSFHRVVNSLNIFTYELRVGVNWYGSLYSRSIGYQHIPDSAWFCFRETVGAVICINARYIWRSSSTEVGVEISVNVDAIAGAGRHAIFPP
jgi:hypothetical protein